MKRTRGSSLKRGNNLEDKIDRDLKKNDKKSISVSHSLCVCVTINIISFSSDNGTGFEFILNKVELRPGLEGRDCYFWYGILGFCC